jgi:DNA-binding CsgD family transcriptional regulator
MSSVFELSGLIEIATFEGAFDLLHAGVVFVDRDCKIMHANRAARAMLEKGSPIRSVHGDLKTPLPRSTTALKKAVAIVVEPAIGGTGIGVPVPQSDGDPAYIHVLPLVTGDTRSGPAGCVTAAVFVTVWDGRAGPPVEAVAAVFGLTAGEIHVAERLLTGRTPAEIAEDLALAMSTVRSHLKSIFAKTGTSRQSDLVRLATQLAAPIECVTRLNDRSAGCPPLGTANHREAACAQQSWEVEGEPPKAVMKDFVTRSWTS